MFTDERKLHLIKEVIKVKNEAVLAEIEEILNINNKPLKKLNIDDFVGIISESEADEMMRAIAETCENIDENDWK